MSLAIAVLGDSPFTLGFELAGIKDIISTENKTAEESADIFFATLKRDDLGILIVNENSLKALNNVERMHAENSVKPVVLILTEAARDIEGLRKQIIKAIGVDVL